LANTLLRAGIKWLEQFRIEEITCRGILPQLRHGAREFFYRPEHFDEGYLNPPSLYLWTGPPELAEAVYDANNWHLTYADGLGGFTP
jgi:hypothetical protein